MLYTFLTTFIQTYLQWHAISQIKACFIKCQLLQKLHVIPENQKLAYWNKLLL